MEKRELHTKLTKNSFLKGLPKLIPLRKSEEQQDTFAFVIHPLDTSYLKKNLLVRLLSKFIPQLPEKCERLISHLPGYRYGEILNIKSEATGKVVHGRIYTVTDTPKMILSGNADRMNKKIGRLSEMAFADGAKIIGLGAYTKAYGDQGVTLAKTSPIPLTTGNSLSAASTLWSAEYAVNKVDLVPQYLGIYRGKAMVIGATGSIGQACARLLAERWEEVVLVAPRLKAIEKLAEEIREQSPNCHVSYCTDANELITTCDLIITATTARRKIVDIERVKAGAVICDTSRPFDISKEDAMKRPDVMVIAAGEVILPGVDQKIACDLGLEGKRVYACLAETALLALEGNFTNFTLGRDIDPMKVKIIDRLARKHGLKLAPLMGHDQIIQEMDFALCRAHALSARTQYTRLAVLH